MATFEEFFDVHLKDVLSANVVALSSVFAAATAIATMFITIPIGIGFLNFGEIVIYTAAFLFGGIVSGLAGGIGAAVADVILGFGMFAPITFVAKGIEGYVVGVVSGESTRRKAIAVAAGAPFMIVTYFLAVWFLEGFPVAVSQELPIDILQAIVGFVVALPVSKAIQNRLPEIR